MRSSLYSISCLLGGIALFLVTGLAGCGDFCITGFSVNGTGQVNVNAGNPPPPCTLPHVNTMMRTVALKTRACEVCSNAVKIAHVFVTLQGIQLHPAGTEEAASSKWIEITPQFAGKPRQIDLIGESGSELLQENALVPAGSYREVRLKLFTGSSGNAEKPASEDACGGSRWNCLVMANGQVQELGLPNEDSELLLPIDTDSGNGAFLLLPDSKVALQLRLEPRQVFSSSPSRGWKPQIILTGHATIEPQSSETEKAIPEI
jgi:hypothetical protein